MQMNYISTRIDDDNVKTMERAKNACKMFRLDAIALSPVLVLDYLHHDDWLFDAHAFDLMKLCTDVYIFADEVSELMIAEIRKAHELGLPVHFYDADLNEVSYDALIINKRIGPGYRKMIAEANGETCCSGICPFESECCERHDTEKKGTDTVKNPAVTEKKKSFLARLFGRAR